MAQCSATEGEDFESKVPVHITLSYGMSLTKLRADQEISNIRAKVGYVPPPTGVHRAEPSALRRLFNIFRLPRF